jgi:hypothetical protein
MIHSLRRLLYESTPAEFRSAYGIAESVERLRAATKRSTFAAIGEAAAVGKVSQDSVRLQRVIPMVHNSFKAFYVGRFESRDGATVLTGRFGMSLFTKIFMTFWLGMVTLFAGGFLIGSLSAATSYPRPLVIGPFLMLVAGFGLVALGKWFARNDVAWLTGVIGRALDVPGVGAEPMQETLEVAAVPLVLKGVALFMAASGVMAVLTQFIEPKLSGQQVVALPLGHWSIVYAVSAFVLAAGVWGRRPWAWWGGFLLLGISTVTSLLAMAVGPPSGPPAFMRVVFGVFAVVVVGVWGRWWYAQRKHFLEIQPMSR